MKKFQFFRYSVSLSMVIILLITTMSYFSSCSSNSSNVYGNTNGNILNGGFFAQQDNVLYYIYTNYNTNERDINNQYISYIEKMDLNTFEKEKLVTIESQWINPFLNVIGDWIYYISREYTDDPDTRQIDDNVYSVRDREYYIYKIKTDGSQRTQLTNEYTYNIIAVINDWIYYTANGFYKIKTDGSEKTMIIPEEKNMTINSIDIVENWVYYHEDESICRIKTDGTNKEVLYTGKEYSYFIIENNTIYFDIYDEYENSVICKINTDGSNYSVIKDNSDKGSCNFINVSGDWIYYIRDDEYLYKMKTDGTNEILLNNDERSRYLHILGDWIYCESDQGGYYRIKTDGSEKKWIWQD